MRLQDIVKEYVRNNRCRPNRELEWFRRQPTLRSAIRSAGLAVNSEGKRFMHQRRLSKASLLAACNSLLRNESRIKRCKDFDELHISCSGCSAERKVLVSCTFMTQRSASVQKLGFCPLGCICTPERDLVRRPLVTTVGCRGLKSQVYQQSCGDLNHTRLKISCAFAKMS